MSATLTTANLKSIALIGGFAVVFLPPVAGVLMLALQVLGDASYDLSRLDLASVLPALFALLAAGTLVGYLYGLVPALIAVGVLSWVIFSGRKLTFGWVALSILAGGIAGFGVMSLLIGGIYSLTLAVTMLLAVSVLWFTLKRFVPLFSEPAK